jgi:hypothetical protein
MSKLEHSQASPRLKWSDYVFILLLGINLIVVVLLGRNIYIQGDKLEQARKNAELLAKLAGATDHENEEGGCVVCMEAAADYAFLPCGHRCVCADHVSHIVGRPCPMCRAEAVQAIRVFD